MTSDRWLGAAEPNEEKDLVGDRATDREKRGEEEKEIKERRWRQATGEMLSVRCRFVEPTMRSGMQLSLHLPKYCLQAQFQAAAGKSQREIPWTGTI